MSSSGTVTTAAWTVAAGPNSSEKKVIMRELEQKLKGRQTPEGKLNDSPKLSQKDWKQVINENMLAARARWITQSRDKAKEVDTTASGASNGGGGSEESDSGEVETRERRGLALSCEPTTNMRVDGNETIELRANRAYSNNSFPNRIIPKPPKNPPPPLTNPERISSSAATAAIASGCRVYGGEKRSKDGAKKQSSGSSTSSAMKKLFGIKPKKKRKVTKKMTSIAPTRMGSVKGEKTEKKSSRGGEGKNAVRSFGQMKSMSDSVLIKHEVLASTSSAEEELNSLPIYMPSLGYQNVFDNPQFAKYTQQHQQKHESRSNTSSPLDSISCQQMKKPKPLPRPSVPGSAAGRILKTSTGSDQESEQETPPPTLSLSPLIISPMMANSPNSAHSDSLTPVFSSSQYLNEGDETIGATCLHDSNSSLGEHQFERSDDSYTSSGSMLNPKERLGKTASYNPDSTGWALTRRGSSQKQKDLRRGICSEGDPNEFEEDYITMNSIHVFEDTTLSDTENTNPQTANHNSNFLSLGKSLNVPTDSKRLSAAYLKILPYLQESGSQKSTSPTKTASIKDTNLGGSREKIKPGRPPPPTKPPLHKGNTVPSISIHRMRKINTPDILDRLEPKESPAEDDRRSSRSATPPKSSPILSAKFDNMELPKASKRKFQYTTVMVEAAGNQRKPSAPRKFKYQTVTLRNESERFKVTEAKMEEELHDMMLTPTGAQAEERRGNVEIDCGRWHPASKHHPLVNLSSGGRRSPLDVTGTERSYYVNRDSLIMMENSKDLPTTMLSTVDPVTGKVLWHEYVEIDEEEINHIATSMGMVKSAPVIPDKLKALLNFNTKDFSCQDEFERPGEKGADKDLSLEVGEEGNASSTPEGMIEDSDLSCDSSVSSECKYIMNIDEPPTIPPRPENLDELVDQLKVRSSGDYSYVFIPSVGTRWMKFGHQTSPRTFTSAAKNSCPETIGENVDDKCKNSLAAAPRVKSPVPSTKSAQPNTRPPSLPPRTDSLLREQELVKGALNKNIKPQPYLLPIIVKTKSKKSFHPSKSSPGLIQSPKTLEHGLATSIQENNQTRSHLPRRRNTPPRVIPYKEHQKQRLQDQESKVSPKSTYELLTVTSPPLSSTETTSTLLLSPDSPIKREAVRVFETKKPIGRSRPHKKLARQRSHRASRGRTSYHKAATKQKEESEKLLPRQPAHESSLDQESGHHEDPKQNSSQATVFNFSEKLNRESLAILVQNQDEITEQLRGSITEPKTYAEGSRTEQNEMEASRKARGLNEILVELGHLLKSSSFTEEDLISVIESHLKQTFQKGEAKLNDTRGSDRTDEKENDTNKDVEEVSVEEGAIGQEVDEYDDEDEEWMSGEEPESDIELGGVGELAGNATSSYINLQIGDEEFEPVITNNPEEDDIDSDKESDLEKEPGVLSAEGNVEEGDGSWHSYINLEFGTGAKIFEQNESQRNSYINLDIETNLDLALHSPRSPNIGSNEKGGDVLSSSSSPEEFTNTSAAYMKHSFHASTSSSSFFSAGPRQRSKTSANYQSPRQQRQKQLPRSNRTHSNPDPELADQQRQQYLPRSSRTHSNPDPELADAVVAAAVTSYQPGSFPAKFRPQKNKGIQPTVSDIQGVDAHKKLQVRSDVEMKGRARAEKTSSYCLALQMEDRHLSQAEEISTSRRRLSAVREEGTHGDVTSDSNKSLQRVNALVTRKRPKGATSSNTGSGMFTHKGGRLTKEGSDVTIEIPEGAIPRGQSQKLWFNVVQSVYDPSSNEDASCLSLSDSIGTIQVESLLQEKREKHVQLSPMIVVGPSDAVLERPLIIRMPHCLPYRNNSWHLQMLGQPSNEDGKEEEWSEIVNTIGLVQLPPVRSKSKFHNRSTYQMHLDYVQIKTSQLGIFKLVARPIRNGTYAGKKMVASVYAKTLPEIDSVQIDIFVNNAIEDQSQALDHSLTAHEHTPLMRDMPILCFGDGKDMEITLSNDSNSAIPLGTKAVPFGQFWRNNKVGSSHVMFEVEEELVEDDRALTLKVQQAGSKLYHETNFLLPDLMCYI